MSKDFGLFAPVNGIYDEYKSKLITAKEAASMVKSGMYLHFGLMNGIVVDIQEALAERTEELEDVTIIQTMWSYGEKPPVLKNDPHAEHFHCASTHLTKQERAANKDGNFWFLPVQFRENPKLHRECRPTYDIAFLQVAPMDASGNFNIGPQVAEYWGVFQNCNKIIVEVNENLIVTHGVGNYLNINQVDYIVEGSNTPMPTVGSKVPTDIDKRMAENIVEHLEDGATLQLGNGAFPNCVGSLIVDSNLKDLGCHTEMFVDAYLKLYEAGKLTNMKKGINQGKMTFTFAQGTEDLYKWMDNNPMMMSAPVDYVNNVDVIASNHKMTSINSCLQIDLFGQVNSESSGLQHIGGTGGQLDFVMGAFQSEGGKSFLCTPSTRTLKDGTVESLIMPTLPQGSIVSTPRSGVHYIVTEYGAVNLKGKTTYERAKLLISVAHPDFRAELEEEAQKMGIWPTSSKVMK